MNPVSYTHLRDDLVELAKKYQDKTETQSTLDVGKEEKVVNEDYYDYSYDSDDMDYLMRKQDEKEFIYNSSNSLHAYDNSCLLYTSRCV